MLIRLRHLWDVMTTGYWFVPTMMSLSAVALAFTLLWIDRRGVLSDDRLRWLYAGGSEGARTLLATVAGSVITVAGVAFSITVAALAQASSQFGPRLLRNFLRDTGNQIVLGTFVATFLYCLLILRTVHGEVNDFDSFVPQASVTASVLMAAACIATLIYFIHHVSVSLQAPRVVAAVAAELQAAINELGLAEQPEPRDAPRANHEPADEAGDLLATDSGYLQAVSYGTLVEVAEREDAIIRLECRPGDHIIQGTVLAWIWPQGKVSAVKSALARSVIIGRQRTPEQDIEYAVRQLVEIGVRALSPGINDPFTAINCIDALAAGLWQLGTCRLPGPHLFDGRGRLRVIRPVATFEGVVDAALNQLRQHGRGNVAVVMRLLEVLARCLDQPLAVDRRSALRRQADAIHAEALESIRSPRDLSDIAKRWDRVVRSDAPVRSPAAVPHT